MIDLFHPENFQNILAFLAGFSVITFFASLLCIPFLVSRLPRNYFQKRVRITGTAEFRSTIRFFVLFLFRNVLGLLLVGAGIAMLFLPGQGILTMIIGIAVMSFPYKQHLIHQLTRPVSIQRGMDWLRTRSGKETFHW